MKNTYYDFFKRKTLSDLDITIITLVSGVVNSILTNPIWFINREMTVAKEKKGLWQTIKDAYKREGIAGFYRGLLPNIILVINPIINFVIYENLKKLMLKRKYSLNTLQLLIISSIAKTIATIFTYPILTIRVKMQATPPE